jgi:hypothetical protein
VLLCVPGPLRRPPSGVDLNIYQLAPGTIAFDHQTRPVPPARRVDVPGLANVFLMENVLSKGDCQRLIAAAEAIGYVADAAEGIDNIQLYAEDSLLLPVFERCRALLPPSFGAATGAATGTGTGTGTGAATGAGPGAGAVGASDNKLVGINARWRFFRYYQHAVYRPHIDGAWPGSGIDPQTGSFVDDIHVGTCVSKLTFLVYLNGVEEGGNEDEDGKGGSDSGTGAGASAGASAGGGTGENSFQGGSTTFYQPSAAGLGRIDARSVQPKTGAVLCFAHGDIGSLVHEGSAVVGGTRTGGAVAKYVIRTDVIYTCSTTATPATSATTATTTTTA